MATSRRKIEVEVLGDSRSLERAFGRSSRSAKEFNRDFGKATRGALAGSGVFRGLGRSLAFASGGFLAFASVSDLLRKSVDAAVEQAQTQKQLAAQFRATGLELATYNKQIEETTSRLSLLSGFQDDELKRSFTTAFRGTKDVTASLKLEAVAADVARGTHKDLSVVTLALTKGYLGQATALRRLGILLPANAKGMQLLNLAAARFAGQARAGTTAQQRLAAVFHNTEEIIGGALLPTINRLTTQFTVWLHRMNESGELQRKVNEIVGDGAKIVHGLARAFDAARTVLSPFVKLLGGLENTATLVGIAFVGLKVKAFAAALGITAAGDASAVAGGKVAALGARMNKLPARIGIAILVGVELVGPGKKLFEQVFGADFGGPKAGAGVDMFQERAQAQALALVRRLRAAGNSTKAIRQALLETRRFSEEAIANAINQTTRTGEDVRLRATPQPGKGISGRLGLLAKFAKLELALARAQLTKTESDDKKILELEKQNLEQQLASRKLSLKERTALTQQLVGVENQITGIEENATKRAADLLKKSQDAQRKRTDALRKAAQKAKAAREELRQTIQDALATARTSIGDLFTGPVFQPTDAQRKAALGAPTPGANVKTLTADLRAQLVAFKSFQHDLADLQKRGAPPELLAELRAQGLGAAVQTHALATASRGQLGQFFKVFGQREAFAAKVARATLQAQRVEVRAQKVVIDKIEVWVDGDRRTGRVKTTPRAQTRGRNPGVPDGWFSGIR